MVNIRRLVVSVDEDGLSLRAWLKKRCPGLPLGRLYKLCRIGQIRLDEKRVNPSIRIASNQIIKLPSLRDSDFFPVRTEQNFCDHSRARKIVEFIRSITIYEDEDVLVLNKPGGLAVQGGLGITDNIDDMLAYLVHPKGHVPRLVHRIDKDTSGCLLIAKRRSIAAGLALAFRERCVRKVYWALVNGIPRSKRGRISTFVLRDVIGEKMRIASSEDSGAVRAVSYYSVVDAVDSSVSWLSLEPVTGRTHQLRAHCAHIGNAIIGDSKYCPKAGCVPPFSNVHRKRLHLLARRIILQHPRSKRMLDITAPLPSYMQESWEQLGFAMSEKHADAMVGV